jgi:hypothetical protein
MRLSPDTYSEVLTRILFVLFRAHPEWTYRSNMADISVPIFAAYVGIRLLDGDKIQQLENPEEQTFTALEALISDLHHVLVNNEAKSGISITITKLASTMRWADTRYYDWLCRQQLDPGTPLYAHSWISCLFTRDVQQSNIYRIYDFLLSNSPGFSTESPREDALVDFCAAVLLSQKPSLIPPPAPSGKRTLWHGLGGDDENLGDGLIRQLDLLRNLTFGRIGLDHVVETAMGLREAQLTGDAPRMPGIVEEAADHNTATVPIQNGQQAAPSSDGWSYFEKWRGSDIGSQNFISRNVGIVPRYTPPIGRGNREPSTSEWHHRLSELVRNTPSCTKPTTLSSLPRSLLLSGSARRVSGSSSDRMRAGPSSLDSPPESRHDTSVYNPPISLLSPPSMDGSPLYRINSRSGSTISRLSSPVPGSASRELRYGLGTDPDKT